ncbi:nitroreductase family deazaflavin-dependent oxidoreductase [Amycolatopsis sp. NPDC004368]
MGLRKLISGFGKTTAFAALGRVIMPADRVVLRVTGGRLGVGTPLGVPALLLTTIGRTSGEPRQVPLLYVERDGGHVVVGSNWGGEKQPAWSANLLANPEATITIRGVTTEVRGRLLEGAEREETWRAVAKYWPAYDTYAVRAAHREIRVFHLSPR